MAEHHNRSRRLRGKTAIITGAAAGIGLGTAQLFAEEGASLILVDRNADKLEQAAEQARSLGAACETVPGDVAQQETARQAAQLASTVFGKLDIVFNNAGIMPLGNLLEYPESLWDAVMNVNVKSMFLMAKVTIPLMLQSGGGSIINMSSVNAFLTEPDHAAYTSSKAAIIGLTKQIGVEFAARGIRCNAICPGWVETDMNLRLAEELGGMDRLTPIIQKQQPLGRMATVREVAQTVLFLASDDSSAVTGSCLYVDGACSASI